MKILCLIGRTVGVACLTALNALPVMAQDSSPVGITEDLPYAIVNHLGTEVRVERIQDNDNRLVDDFARTSRPCPPFCIHHMEAAPGVRTVGELELLSFIQNEVADERGLLIDARMANWYRSETIPGAVNVPFIIFTNDSERRDRLLGMLGVRRAEDGSQDFSDAIELMLFCNGPWCDQSPRAIAGLIGAGYPPEKLHYYRGGMQAWKSFGLTTVLPENNNVERAGRD